MKETAFLAAVFRVLFIVGFQFVCFSAVPAVAEPPQPNISYGDFSADIYLRARYELTDWLDPKAPPSDPNYSFGHTKLQLGLKYAHSGIKAYVQGQYFQLYDLPDDGVGPGAAYFVANDKEHSPGDFVLRQGYLSYIGGGASGTLGRFIYSNGMEGLSKDEAVIQLRQKRISERVFGPFDFTAGRSFDGARAGWNQEGIGALDVAAFRPTQGGFATDGSSEIEDIFVLTTALSVSPELTGSADVQLFYYFYGDDRGGDVVKVDNRALDLRKLDLDKIEIHNFGFHAVDVYRSGGVQFDWLVWAVAQAGDWGTLDHSAFANALEGGARLTEVSGKPWFRAGWNWSTGDANPNDGHHHTFFQMLPTARQYAETPFYNLMNNQDLFANAAIDVADGVTVKAETAYLWAAQARDLLYSGGGATKETQFGYSGAPLSDSRAVGLLASLQGSYKVSNLLTLSLYYGHLFGAGALEAAFARNDIDYGFAEAILKY